VRAPELHQESPEAFYAHVPGVKVAVCSTPADAKGLLASSIRDDDPVVFLEPKRLYRSARAPVPEGAHAVPLGSGRVERAGDDVTVVAYGAMVPVALAAAELAEADGSCEVIDLRSLKPLDEELILSSVAKTGRVVVVHEAPRTGGFGGEIAALVAERAVFDLRAPVLRVTGYDTPYPYWAVEDRYMPSPERIADAVRAILEM
jgi:pyruvate/2-oxoglutarate/acetoin dehydrogenase E1 component